jgi:hypothetical protein
VQELWLLIKADQPITDVELFEDTKHMHKIHVRAFIDKQEFSVYRHVVTSHPSRSGDNNLHNAHRPSIKVSFFVARRPQFFIWNLYFMMVGTFFSELSGKASTFHFPC